MISTVPLACFLSMIRPPGVQFENALLQITPVDKAKCPFVKDGTDIGFRLYTRHNPTVYQELALGDDERLFASNMDFHAPTVVYFSAFMETPDDGSGLAVREAYALRGDSNIIMVDASSLLAGPWYFTAAENTWFVGRYAARFIDYLVSRGLNLSNTHLIGHSLGAQSAGVCGAAIKSGRVSRITGLDPALPLFAGLPLEQRLDKSDADFVDVIHTDSGIFGYPDAIGHVDFYPNGGVSPQPGCELEVVIPQGLLLNKCDETKRPPHQYFTFYLTPNTTTPTFTDRVKKLFTFIHHQQGTDNVEPIHVRKEKAVMYITGDDYDHDRNDTELVNESKIIEDKNQDEIVKEKAKKLNKQEHIEKKQLVYDSDMEKANFGMKKHDKVTEQDKNGNIESNTNNDKLEDQIMIDSELKLNVHEFKPGFERKKQLNHDTASITTDSVNDELCDDDEGDDRYNDNSDKNDDDLMMTESETEYSTELYEECDDNESTEKPFDEIEVKFGYDNEKKVLNDRDSYLDKLNITNKDLTNDEKLEDQIMLESKTETKVTESVPTRLDGIFGKIFQIRDKRLVSNDEQQTRTTENDDNQNLKQQKEGIEDPDIKEAVEAINESRPINNLTRVENKINDTKQLRTTQIKEKADAKLTEQNPKNTRKDIKKQNTQTKADTKKPRSRRFISFFKRSEAEENENFLFKMLNFLIKNRPNLPVYSVMREINTLVKSANGELNHVTKERNNFIGAPPSLAPITYTLELGNESKTVAFVKRLLGLAPKGDRLTINGNGK